MSKKQKKVEVIDKHKLLKTLNQYVAEGKTLIKSSVKNENYLFAAKMRFDNLLIEGLINDVNNGIFDLDTES